LPEFFEPADLFDPAETLTDCEPARGVDRQFFVDRFGELLLAPRVDPKRYAYRGFAPAMPFASQPHR
jgi:hypothetical protein